MANDLLPAGGCAVLGLALFRAVLVQQSNDLPLRVTEGEVGEVFEGAPLAFGGRCLRGGGGHVVEVELDCAVGGLVGEGGDGVDGGGVEVEGFFEPGVE